jgi:uncharacterized membrane protein YccC
MRPDWKSLLLYMAKCIVATLVVFGVTRLLDYKDIIWPLVSAILVLTPDSNEAVPLAAVRIGANLIASGTSLICLLFGLSNVFTLCVGFSLTILLCAIFRLMAGSRSALAAVAIIMMHEQGTHLWDAAAERAAMVIAGCLLGLVITFVFHRSLTTGTPGEGQNQAE